MTAPLSAIKVIEIGTLITAPFAARSLPDLLGHEVPGQLAKAGRNCDLHPIPT
ncbi:hypothetical protein [Pseudomonas sp. B33.4]|uniref:hypothetical protein n=1 Tax=Pseudomonas sp. B33.4 TaxID=3104265 RepID=UPI002ADEE806|nr:hypothetical protein [Pseudomonas sp. B33.4]